MKNTCSAGRVSARSHDGFTALEMVVVLGIIGILLAVSVPSFLQMRQNAEYRRAARDIASMLRDARNKTITTNTQYCVAFDTVNKRYGERRGNRAYNTDWTDTASNPLPQNWITLATQVTINTAGVTLISFNPNGTAGASDSILIQNSAGQTVFTIDVNSSGKIKITP
jgi:prepilin-type N-terminal cleavage/methylation domain-containing protein